MMGAGGGGDGGGQGGNKKARVLKFNIFFGIINWISSKGETTINPSWAKEKR